MDRIIGSLKDFGDLVINTGNHDILGISVIGTAIICSDLKLTQLEASLKQRGIITTSLYGGIYPLAFKVSSAIEHITDQWNFFCDHFPGREIALFTTHDECRYPESRGGKDDINPVEQIKISIENFQNLIKDPIGGRINKAIGIHFGFQNGKIIPQVVVKKYL